MSSLVLDLQQEVMKSDCDILSALRKAHLIAAKLKLTEFDTWIQRELNGYIDCENKDIPDYRNIFGELKGWNPYRGWLPVVFQNEEIESMICRRKLPDSISNIIELYKSSENLIKLSYPADMNTFINKSCTGFYPTNFVLEISSHLLKSIVDRVGNCLLEWTIKLESDGILGEEMRFNQEETIMAKNVPQQINYYYGNVVVGDVKESQLVSGNNNTISFHYDQVENLIRQIKDAVEKDPLSKEDRESADELIAEVEAKIASKKNPAVIKAALAGLKDFLIGAGANVAGALIMQYLQ